ncbi:hypothetical protein M513_03256 [Trichuris suis]|uniref:Uncharacterized protein n=1 Tax=Trichuris suis TaxID=68888 RepID=A0A085MF21_9BILA|nr:hypothetical protein M513_03256 [Trichuris suis]
MLYTIVNVTPRNAQEAELAITLTPVNGYTTITVTYEFISLFNKHTVFIVICLTVGWLARGPSRFFVSANAFKFSCSFQLPPF